MNKQNNDKSKIILGIILTVIIILCAIYVEIFNNDNNSENITNDFYSNLNIDKSQLNVFYLNVGQADSILITMGNETILIDAGNEKDGYYISQFLKAQRIEQIDYLIETHSDDDHSGGVKTISQNFTISKVYMPQSAIAKSEIKDDMPINTFDNLEQTYKLDKATWRVLSVDNSENVKPEEDNNTSIVIQLSYGDTKFLFMGDSEEKVEKNLLKADKLEEIDVLKVAHHGSNSSTSQAFLDKIKPKYSIISVNHEEYKNIQVIKLCND